MCAARNIEGRQVRYVCPALLSSTLSRGNGTPTGRPSMLHDCPPEYRHQLREPWVDARAVQALVVVLPEHLPVALNGLGHAVADDELIELPVAEPLERYVDTGREGRRIGSERREHEAVPLHRRQAVERVVAHLEAIAG